MVTLGATGLAALTVTSGAVAINAAAATGGGGPVAQSVLGSGSDTTQFMMHQLDGLYLFSPGCQQIPLPGGPAAWLDFSCMSPDPAGTITTENYAHDQVHEAYFLGSGNGIKQLCTNGSAGVAAIDFARSSRVPGTADCAGLHFVAYARDGISWEAFDTNTSGVHLQNNQAGTCAGSGGLTQFCLSQSDLQGIFVTCTITNWNQVGGQTVAISIYTPQSGSGTRKTFDAFLGGDSSKCIPAAQQPTHIIDENMNMQIPVADQPNAIFPFSAGVWKTQVNGKGGAVLGAIDNVYPSNSAISSGSFPYGRFLYNVTCVTCANGKQSSPATIQYVGEEGWICKQTSGHNINPVTGNNFRTDIAQAIGAAGFVPVLLGPVGGGSTVSDYCRLTTT
jgi:ABC-type phosphate transport system substrate-binding protein